LLKAIIPFYIICFGLYVFFSRQPDYQDGKITTGVIHYLKDSQNKPVAKAIFSIDKMSDTVNAAYPLRHPEEGQQVKIIYETNNPAKAAVYSWWGYWFKWDELLASILIPVVFLYAAKAITANPSAEAVIDEMEINTRLKRKNNN